MALSPLAVMLLAQLGLVMLAVIIFQKLQKRRLIKEIENLKSPHRPFFADNGNDESVGFDQQQAELLLNRIFQKSQNIVSEAPAAQVLGEEQQALLYSLGECIGTPLESAKKQSATNPALNEDTDIISQQEIDTALGRGEVLEEFDMDDFEDLETSADTTEDNLDLPEDEYQLPEDSVQVALDKMDDFDMDDFENELKKIDD